MKDHTINSAAMQIRHGTAAATLCREQRRGRRAFTLIELLISTAVISVLISMLLPAVQMAREAARRASCQSQLRQLALALHQFHDVHRVFPASGWTVPGPGNPRGRYIGWRAMILPFLEQTALFDEYEFDADWWDQKNLRSGTHQITLFQCPSVPQQPPIDSAVAKSPRPPLALSSPLARADYEALMGVRAVIKPDVYSGLESTRSVMYRNSTVRFADITDGTSTTIVVTECAARPSVYRNGIRYSAMANDQGYGWVDSESAFSLDGASRDGSVQGLDSVRTPRGINATNENEPYSFHSGGAHFLFADGHVTFLSENIQLDILAALATRSAGEIVAPF